MDINEGLKHLWNSGIHQLNIYWLEDITPDDAVTWWVDVCEDTLDAMCETRWAWDILSKAEVDKDDTDDIMYRREDDECVIIVDELFSEDVIKNAVEGWLRERGHNFKVNVIDPEGTVEMTRMLEIVEEARAELKYNIDDIWSEEDVRGDL